ncbi:MAG TPA: rhamnulokinase family protein [Vicinamibacterales bacterium]|nr:rhamnulokinase family protein [Vicinamibacterales bacterium]
MSASAQFLAFDLGAESGRAMLGRLRSGALDLTEIHRFVNEPVRQNGSLQWDVLRIWLEIKHGLERAARAPIDSIGVDAWGCDYALLGEQGVLIQNPYHYRDNRTDGVMDAVFQRVPAEEIYAATGIQFLPFNTLYQLYAACRATPRLIDAATAFGTIPDLFNFWLTGNVTAEYTNATTTQFVDARTRSWAIDLLQALDLPTRILPPIVEPGTIVGKVGSDAPAALVGRPVVAPACHDTGSAVAAVRADGHRAFISSGTWSLLGTELRDPVITERARELNFTNEGGVCGTTRFLKNIAGLWLLQSCRRAWADQGVTLDYDELLRLASTQQPAFRSLFDPDHGSFLHPRSMVTAIAEYCRDTDQPEPETPAAYARAILESLAFKYRVVLESMEQLTGVPITEIRIVGGGSRNRLLNQFTADATGRSVLAGPIEASALGNIAMQMVATGAVASLGEARDIIERSFPVERFEPIDADRWNAHYRRFHEYLEPTCV